MSERPRHAPPNFVPTLTEVVRPDPDDTPSPVPLALPAEFANLLEGWPVGPNTATSPVDGTSFSASKDVLPPAMLERILLRIELSLSSRLKETVDSVVEAHMQSFKGALRAEISATVRDAVKQAVMQETAETQPEYPPR